MFYCNTCADKRKWPKSFMPSYGPCELCKKPDFCNDVPSKDLPKEEEIA